MEPPVDLEHLARYTGGQKALNQEILTLFDSQMADMLRQLDGIAAARDARRWREVTHTIKGAARGVGAFGIGQAAAEAEPLDLSDHEGAAAAIGALARETDSVRRFIAAYLAA